MNQTWLIIGIVLLIGNILFYVDDKRKYPEKRHLNYLVFIGIFLCMIIVSLL